MSTKCDISFYSLFLFFCAILFFRSGRVSGFNPNPNEDKIEPVKIEKEKSCAPKEHIVSFNAPTQEKFELKFTGHSFEAIANPSTTVGTATGGSIGTAIYKHYKFVYYWTICDNKITFETNVIYYNLKYGTYENALKHNGVFLIAVPVEADGCVDNPAFEEFEKIMHKIKKPGDCTLVHSTASYIWFKNFPLEATYSSFTGTLHNKETGEHLEGLTINKFPPEPRANFISRQQFERTFGSLTDGSGHPATIPPPELKATSSINKQKGIIIKLVPG